MAEVTEIKWVGKMKNAYQIFYQKISKLNTASDAY
jgi:hypothetical protein